MTAVWIESTITRSGGGPRSAACASTLSASVSHRMRTPCDSSPRRSARSRTCAADSSPATYNTRLPTFARTNARAGAGASTCRCPDRRRPGAGIRARRLHRARDPSRRCRSASARPLLSATSASGRTAARASEPAAPTRPGRGAPRRACRRHRIPGSVPSQRPARRAALASRRELDDDLCHAAIVRAASDVVLPRLDNSSSAAASRVAYDGRARPRDRATDRRRPRARRESRSSPSRDPARRPSVRVDQRGASGRRGAGSTCRRSRG